MILSYVKIAFLLIVVRVNYSEKIYEWRKLNIPPLRDHSWRPTSFAITKNSIYLTLIDTNNVYGSGVVGWFNKSTSKSPEIKLYSSPSTYRIVDPRLGKKMIAPFAVRTDNCNRLWILDSAVQNISGTQRKENPTIYVSNLSTNNLIRTYSIPKSQWSEYSFFVNFVIDSDDKTEEGCDRSHAYLADFNRFGLLTYDFKKNHSVLKTHHFFSPDPLIAIPEKFVLNNGKQDLGGIFSLTLAKTGNNETDALFFNPLASRNEFSVETECLKQEKPLSYKDVKVYKDKGPETESGSSVYDPVTNNIFFGEINSRKIGCWNLDFAKGDIKIKSVYNKLDVPDVPEGFIVDLAILDSELWMLVHHDSKIAIHKEKIEDLIRGTSCDANSGLKPRFNSASYNHLNLGILLIIYSILLIV